MFLLISAGCATSDFAPNRILRPAVDVPERFWATEAKEGAESAESTSGTGGCRNPMFDPRDGARLTLVRSGNQQGDYRAPAGRYGVGPGELLRIDCGSGRARGVVSE